MRYCEKCATIKPDRAHHCSVCGTCVLKVQALNCSWIFTKLSSLDGPPLSVGEQLCGLQQLQVFRPFLDVWTPLLPLCRPYKLEIFSSGTSFHTYSCYCILINAPEFSQPLKSRYLIIMLQFWRDVGAGQGQGQFHILFLFFVSSMFSISLCSLLGYHIHLVLNNRTTLEAFRWYQSSK